ncbi:MAG: hypothetical protein EF811_03915 [Methanonatronarchaeia archaeon]|nr:MAG: hypothetical protein EF811_03915 [Methanonatronarchaeia archaeon]
MEIPRKNQATRRESWKQLKQINPYKIIAPYGLPDKLANINNNYIDEKHKTNILTIKEETIPRISNIEIRTNNKIHAKLWIGKQKTAIGSWNYTETNKHDYFIIKKTTPSIESFFNEIWRRSRGGEDS